ncbi:TIR domain-containing protein [Azotobacter chroococcum]
MSTRHRVFVSYHHALDEGYKRLFEQRFGNTFGAIVPGSVQVGDINPYLSTDTIRQKIRDEYLRDTSVTVVLIGAETWQRKHVDWEIGSSIRHTQFNSRSGLLGIILPPTRAQRSPCTTRTRFLHVFTTISSADSRASIRGRMMRQPSRVGFTRPMSGGAA